MKDIYGRCKIYGRKNILVRFVLGLVNLFRFKKGYLLCKGQYDISGLDKSEEEQ